MGLDLTLVPERHPGLDWFLAYTRLSLNCMSWDLGDVISKQSYPLRKAIDWYGDEGIEKRTEDCYGEELTFILQDKLSEILESVPTSDPWDIAVRAFVKALAKETRIVLWWS